MHTYKNAFIEGTVRRSNSADGNPCYTVTFITRATTRSLMTRANSAAGFDASNLRLGDFADIEVTHIGLGGRITAITKKEQ